MGLRAAVRAAVAEINFALARMDDGQYGSCVASGPAIGAGGGADRSGEVDLEYRSIRPIAKQDSPSRSGSR